MTSLPPSLAGESENGSDSVRKGGREEEREGGRAAEGGERRERELDMTKAEQEDFSRRRQMWMGRKSGREGAIKFRGLLGREEERCVAMLPVAGQTRGAAMLRWSGRCGAL